MMLSCKKENNFGFFFIVDGKSEIKKFKYYKNNQTIEFQKKITLKNREKISNMIQNQNHIFITIDNVIRKYDLDLNIILEKKIIIGNNENVFGICNKENNGIIITTENHILFLDYNLNELFRSNMLEIFFHKNKQFQFYEVLKSDQIIWYDERLYIIRDLINNKRGNDQFSLIYSIIINPLLNDYVEFSQITDSNSLHWIDNKNFIYSIYTQNTKNSHKVSLYNNKCRYLKKVGSYLIYKGNKINSTDNKKYNVYKILKINSFTPNWAVIEDISQDDKLRFNKRILLSKIYINKALIVKNSNLKYKIDNIYFKCKVDLEINKSYKTDNHYDFLLYTNNDLPYVMDSSGIIYIFKNNIVRYKYIKINIEKFIKKANIFLYIEI